MLGGRPKLPPVSTALDSQRDRAVRKVRETFIPLAIHSRALSSSSGPTHFLGKTYMDLLVYRCVYMSDLPILKPQGRSECKCCMPSVVAKGAYTLGSRWIAVQA